MRYQLVFAAFSVPLLMAQQNPPNCTGIGLQVDVRCACIKDPGSEQCAMVKKGFYEPHDFSKIKGLYGTPAPQPSAQPARAAQPQQARVVPLAHKDYLRFLQPNAQFAAGFDFSKIFQSPELMATIFGQTDNDSQTKIVAAFKEMDHLWFGFAAPSDIVVVMTGKFEQGAAAGMFYSQGIRPVFLADAHAMMIGPEPAVQAALARLAKPAPAAASLGWAARRSRELAKDHETWIVTEPPPGPAKDAAKGNSTLASIRRFALGFRLTGEGSIDGEVVADSDANAEKIAAWVDQMKAAVREKTGTGALDALTFERTGATLKFAAKGDSLLAGDAGKKAVSSDFGVELYNVIASGFPGTTPRTVAADKLLSVKEGMKRDEVVALLGPPLSVAAIQGLDTPRETWTYQVPFGKQLTIRLDNGIVTAAPR
jgi:hypothetical protein